MIIYKRTYQVTISQSILDDLKAKGYDVQDLLWTMSEYANLGENGKEIYLVRYVNKDEKVVKYSDPCWGTYNDVMVVGDTELLYTVTEWDCQEVVPA